MHHYFNLPKLNETVTLNLSEQILSETRNCFNEFL